MMKTKWVSALCILGFLVFLVFPVSAAAGETEQTYVSFGTGLSEGGTYDFSYEEDGETISEPEL